MSKKYLKNPEARHYFEWQEKQRERKDLPDYCIKTLNRVEKNAKKLERQEKGGITTRTLSESFYALSAYSLTILIAALPSRAGRLRQ